MTITELNKEDRPREKLMRYGPSALSTAELMAILVGSGTPGVTAVQMMQQVLAAYDDKLRLLGQATVEELVAREDGRKRFPGMGEAKAVTILAACELCRRRQAEELPERMTIRGSEDIDRYMRPRMEELTREHFYVLCLNSQLQIVKCECLSKGGWTATTVDVRELMRVALLNESTAIAVCHNHPSGSNRPSGNDDKTTAQIAQACAALGIRLTDHVILSAEGYYSYNDNGKI